MGAYRARLTDSEHIYPRWTTSTWTVMTNISPTVAKRALTASRMSKAKTLVKVFWGFFYLMSAGSVKSQDFNFPHTSLLTLQFKIQLRAKGEVQPRHSRLFLLDRALFHSHQLWKCLLLAGFYRQETFYVPRTTWPEWVSFGGEHCIICVYKGRAVGNCKRGPNQTWSNEKFYQVPLGHWAGKCRFKILEDSLLG